MSGKENLGRDAMAKELQEDKGVLTKNLRDILSDVKEHGPMEIQMDGDVFIVALKREMLSDQAREFLIKGGPAA